MVSGGWFSRWTPPEQARSRYEHLLDQGFTVFAVRHGSSPRFKVPDAYGDVRRAVRYVRLHARTFGVDPDRMGVYGGSAGGHLSLMLGLASDDGDPRAEDDVLRVSSRVAAVVAYYPPVDLRTRATPNEHFPATVPDSSLFFEGWRPAAVLPSSHCSGAWVRVTTPPSDRRTIAVAKGVFML